MKLGEAGFIIALLLFVTLYAVASVYQNINVARDYEISISTGKYDISIEILEPRTERKGTVVLIHGIIATKRMLKPLATDLVRYGWRVLLVDQPGHGITGGYYRITYEELETPGVALSRVLNQTAEFMENVEWYLSKIIKKDEKIAFGGHSIGALIAMIMSKNFTINTNFSVVATIGIAPPFWENIVNNTLPKNLLLCIGKHDEFIKADDLKMFIMPDLPDAVPVGETLGNFDDGTARKIIVSEYSDHIFEPYDPVIIGEMIKWLELSLGHESSSIIVLATYIAAMKALSALAGLVLVALLPIVFASNLGMISGGKRFPTIRLIRDSLIASCVVWSIVTIILLTMSLWFIIQLAGILGFIIPVLVGGYLTVATIALVIASSFLGRRDVISLFKKVYLYFTSDPNRGIFLGIIEGSVFIFILDITLGDVLAYMIPRTIGRLVIGFLLGTVIFIYFMFHEYLFRAQIQEIFGGRKRKAVMFSIGISLLSKVTVIMAISVILIYVSPFPVVAYIGVFGMVLVALLTEGLAAASYYATREILPHSFASAIVWASIAAAAFPVVSLTL